MRLSIGSITLDGPAILAPMSGVTDLPFRRMVKRIGAPLVVSEMIASEGVVRRTRQTMRLLRTEAEEQPLAVQLAGREPAVMAEAARLNEDLGAALIDINMGCPVKKVVRGDAGSALMRDEALAGRIMEAVVAAVRVPVTLKMRLGWDQASRNAPRLARIAEQAGIRMITVHGRTRDQFYGGAADWEAIRAVKGAVSIPVVANGDVTSLARARACLDQSGADGVMIGRGAQGRPWLIAQVSRGLSGRPALVDPDPNELLALILGHYEDMLGHYGREAGMRVARKHLAWYTRPFLGAERVRDAINASDNPGVVRSLLTDFYDRLAERVAA